MSSTSAGTDAVIGLPSETRRPIVSDGNLAVVVYVLYRVSYFTGISALIGVIIAHLKVDDTDPVSRSHYQFQLRTFWIGLLYLTTGTVVSIILIGIPILLWWYVWSLMRITKGLVRISGYKPIVNPASWLFG